MQTRILAIDHFGGRAEAVAAALEVLRDGGVVALPTETVYGLAADATHAGAVKAIFQAKGRPAHDPLIVHVNGLRFLDGIAEIPDEIAADVRRIAEAFWPGALTLVLPKGADVAPAVTAGLPTVAVRQSAHPVLRQIIKELGRPLAAPSANRFGRISPTSASAVVSELGGRIPLVIDTGATRDGLESTIIRILPGSGKPFIEILRHGPVTAEMLKSFGRILKPSDRKRKGEATPPATAIEVPGQLESHYAPSTPLLLPARPSDFLPQEGKRYGLLSFRGHPADGFVDRFAWDTIEVLSPGSGKLPEAGVRFFALLRLLDEAGLDGIVAEPLPERGVGRALVDRLRRAAHTHKPHTSEPQPEPDSTRP